MPMIGGGGRCLECGDESDVLIDGEMCLGCWKESREVKADEVGEAGRTGCQ